MNTFIETEVSKIMTMANIATNIDYKFSVYAVPISENIRVKYKNELTNLTINNNQTFGICIDYTEFKNPKTAVNILYYYDDFKIYYLKNDFENLKTYIDTKIKELEFSNKKYIANHGKVNRELSHLLIELKSLKRHIFNHM